MRKRKTDEGGDGEGLNTSTGCIPPSTTEPPMKLAKASNAGKKHQELVILKTYMTDATSSAENRKARETRLEQNRKAARESRRRKKVMIEDLQRSVIFFSRANGALKHQNDDLTRLLMQAQAQASVIESTRNQMSSTPVPAATKSSAPVANGQLEQDSQLQQAVTVSSENEPPTPQTFPNEAKTSSTVATLPTSTPTYPSVPAMQPGATMQAMASFQQAAAAAMQVAVQGMQGISSGATLTSLAQPLPTSGSSSAQQAYNDTMTALAMQQAAIAAAAAAVPPHVMAQIVGSACNSTGWVPAPASTVPASVAPATILPAATIQATSTTASSATKPAPAVTEKGTSKAGSNPVLVALMPSLATVATQGVVEL